MISSVELVVSSYVLFMSLYYGFYLCLIHTIETERERREREREMGEAVVGEQSPSPRSPEAKLGMQVEDLWDTQEPQLSPTEKLNACFESIPVSAFPPAPSDQGIYIHIYM